MTTKNNVEDLDNIFEALASIHRREILYALSLQPYSISQLAEMRKLSLPAIYKHIKLLEKANLIERRKTGQTNYLSLNRQALILLQNWVMQYAPYWGNNKETLENYTKYLDKKEVKEK